MANYTSLSDFAAATWASRRQRPVTPKVARTATTIDESPYLCPRCEEGYAFPSSCARCGEPTVDRRRVLPMPKEVDAHGSLSKDGTFGAVVLFGLAAILPTVYVVLREADRRVGTSVDGSSLLWVAALAIGLAGAVATPVLLRSISATLHRRAAARDARRARAALSTGPSIDTRALPEETSGDGIRLHGIVRFEHGERHVRVRVADEHGSILLPERGDYRAYDATTLARLDALEDGDAVEIVAHGRMQAVAAESYRADEHEFAVHSDAPIHVWVARRPAP
jgi:hypothetical protein